MEVVRIQVEGKGGMGVASRGNRAPQTGGGEMGVASRERHAPLSRNKVFS